MTVKELMNFLSKQNPEAKVTLTKDVSETYIDPDGYGEVIGIDTGNVTSNSVKEEIVELEFTDTRK